MPVLVLHGHGFDFCNEIVNLLEVAAHFLSAVVQKMRHAGNVEEPRVQ